MLSTLLNGKQPSKCSRYNVLSIVSVLKQIEFNIVGLVVPLNYLKLSAIYLESNNLSWYFLHFVASVFVFIQIFTHIDLFTYFSAILAVVLVAVALGISINCHSLSVDHRASVTISDDLATVDLMWAVDMEGKPTARVYPLIAFNETPRPHGVCDADFACIGNNNVHPFVYPLGEQIRCRYCLQTFHAGCIFLPKDELHNWSCECHISHADLNM